VKENRPDDTHFLKLLSNEIDLMEENIKIKKIKWGYRGEEESKDEENTVVEEEKKE